MKCLQAARRAPGKNPFQVVFVWTGIQSLVWLGLRICHRYRFYGRDRVPDEGPLIYASNHQSHLDPMVVGVLVRDRPFTSLARASLFRVKPFGLLLKFLMSLPIDRGRGDREAIKILLGELAAGRCVLIFPEGTRSPDGTVCEFKAGVRLLIKRSGARVVPCAVEGCFDAWPRQRSRPILGKRVAVIAGEPIDAAALLEEREGEPEPLERLRRRIETLRLELRAELRRLSNGRYPAPGPADHAYWDQPAETP